MQSRCKPTRSRPRTRRSSRRRLRSGCAPSGERTGDHGWGGMKALYGLSSFRRTSSGSLARFNRHAAGLVLAEQLVDRAAGCVPCEIQPVTDVRHEVDRGVRRATALRRTLRCPQIPDRRSPVRLCWLCTVDRRRSARPCGTACHTADRTGSSALPSLSPVAPSAAF